MADNNFANKVFGGQFREGQPATPTTRQIFRKGADIFAIDGDKARKLGATEFDRDFAPQTGTIVDNDAEKQTGGGDVMDLGQREDLFSQFFPTPTAPKVPFGMEENLNISEGTEKIEDDVNNIKTDLEDTKADADKAITEAPETSLQNQFSDIQNDIANINRTSKDELRQIEQAGVSAGRQFDPLIREAEETRRQGMPRDVIRAGERGGFMSTQFAGRAALQPIEGGTFVGAGGRLEQQKSAYDRQILDLKSAQQRAISAAESAARTAIRTGKREDVKMSQDMLNLARGITSDMRAAEQQKRNAEIQAQQEARAASGQAFSQQKSIIDTERAERTESRLATTATFNIIKDLLEGDKIKIGDQEFTGIKKEEIDPFFTGSNIISLMKALPVGKTQSIPDPFTGLEMEISGLATDDPNIKTIQSTDDRGNVTITSYRLTSDGGAEIINQAGVGAVGKTKTRASSVTVQMGEQRSGALGDASARLNAAIGSDGKTNTDVFIEERNQYMEETGGDAKLFDESFAHLLSDRADDAKAVELRGRFDLPELETGITPEQEKSLLEFGVDQSLIDLAKASGLSFDELIGQ